MSLQSPFFSLFFFWKLSSSRCASSLARDAPQAFPFVDVAVVAAKGARDPGVVHHLDHRVQAQAHRPLTVVQHDFVRRSAQRRQPRLPKEFIDHRVTHAGGILVVVGQRELLKAEETLVLDFGIVVLKLVEVKLERQLPIAHHPRAQRTRPLVAHAHMRPILALKADSRRHPHGRPVHGNLFPAGRGSRYVGELLARRERSVPVISPVIIPGAVTVTGSAPVSSAAPGGGSTGLDANSSSRSLRALPWTDRGLRRGSPGEYRATARKCLPYPPPWQPRSSGAMVIVMVLTASMGKTTS